MDVTSAVTLVNSLALPPGWRVVASDYTHRFEDSIAVEITALDAANSDESEAPDYVTPVPPDGPRATFWCYVGDASADDLVALVIGHLVEAFTHEAREFVRRPDSGRWVAPFHPHRRAGILAWSERNGTDPAADYTYGTA